MTQPSQDLTQRIKTLLDQGNFAEAQTLIAQLTGSGAIAQGDGATALGERAVNIGGNARDVNTGVQFINNKYAGPDPRDADEARRIYLEISAYTASYLPLGAFDANASNPNAEARRMQLQDVFIRLDTTNQVRKEPNEPEPTTLVGRIKRKIVQLAQNVKGDVKGDIEEKLNMGERDMRPLRAMEAAAQNPALVIIGEPGSGKSTFINFLVYCLAYSQIQTQPDLPEQFSADWPARLRRLIPVRVILRDFEVWLHEQPSGEAGPALLRGFIAHTLRQQNLAFADAWLSQQIEAGNTLFVLDGLDEVTTVSSRLLVRAALQDFAMRHHSNRYLVTCRTLAYQPPEHADAPDLRLNSADFPSFELDGLDDEKIQDFVTAWHTELARTGKFNDARAKDLQRKLWNALQTDDLKRLARNPLQLTLMAWVHTDDDELPDKRARLYDKAVNLLLWRWELQKQYRDKRQTLGELALRISNGRQMIERELRRAAYTAHQALAQTAQLKRTANPETETLADVDEAQLQHALAKLNRDPVTDKPDENWARDVVDSIKDRSGLLARRGENKLTFPHRTFQEFLAGLHLLDDAAFVDRAIQKTTDLTLWREPILLAVGYTVFVQRNTDLEKPLALARRLCHTPCDDADLRWKRVWLAGDVLREVNPTDAWQKDENTVREVQALLTRLITEGQLEPVERARAAEALARIGDPRFDPDLFYLPNGAADSTQPLGFIELPAGPFFMGTHHREFEAVMEKIDGDKKRDFFKAEIWPNDDPVFVERCFIAKYPTTVAQFRAFVRATGFSVGNEDCLRDSDNSPVRFVSWDEALAYCQWLSDVLRESERTPEPLRILLRDQNWHVTLPSEAAWEKAARYSTQSDALNRPLFPWGDELPSPDANDFANLTYSGIRNTCAVGIFPKGASDSGCLDLVGNVWEWTHSLYKPYPYKQNDGREDLTSRSSRVLRGGSWSYDLRLARCAYRDLDVPANRHYNIGFRVMLLPLSSSRSPTPGL